MSTCPTTIKNRRQRGSVALCAVAALVVVFIIAIGLLTLGSSARLSGKRSVRLNAAKAMASAGIEYGYWQYAFNNQPLPYQSSRTLGQGSFTVSVSDNSAAIPGTIKIVSAGSQNGDQAALTRVFAMPLGVFAFAICSNSAISAPATVKINTGNPNGNGSVWANGSLTFLRGDCVINGDALATGAISVPQASGSRYPNSVPLQFPAINLSYYQSIANRTFSGNQNFSGFTFLSPDEVVYVNGNVTLSPGSITGTGTLVASGSVTLAGNTKYLFSTDEMAVLTPVGLSASVDSTVVGIYYAHNSAGTAAANFPKKINVTDGSLAADSFTFNPATQVVSDSTLNPASAKQLHLPGF